MHSTYVPHQVFPSCKHLLANVAENDLHIQRRVISRGDFPLHLAPWSAGHLEVAFGVAILDVGHQPLEALVAEGTLISKILLLDPSRRWYFQVRKEQQVFL